jgi:DNA-binding MarR family transcriptional regulator
MGDLTTREILEELGWTRSTTRAVIAALVEDGQVEGCADAVRSPSQRYRVVSS